MNLFQEIALTGYNALLSDPIAMDIVKSFNTTVENTVTTLNVITIGLLMISAFIIGIMFFFGQKGSEKAKERIPYVIIGAICCMGAVQIAKFVYANIAF